MVARVEQGIAYAQTWDAQNRLIQVTYGSILTTTNSTYSFAYDADGGRVLQVAPGNYKTAYIGAYEETITPTALFTQDFEAGTGNWTINGGTWNRYYNASDTWYYKQTVWEQPGESSAVINPAVTYGEITATARVRLDLGTNVLAGLVLRRNTANNPAYFVGIRNIESGYYCGIYEKSGSTWTNRTGQLTDCKFALGGWRTLMARAVGGRLEFYVDGTLIATWVDSTPLPSYGFGLMTFDGAASFDNVKVYGLSTRSYYAFGSARVAERTTAHTQAAGSGAAPGGGRVYYLAADHLGSTSLALTTSGVVTGTRAYYMPYGAERGPAASLPTDFTYTGQRGSGFGLIHMGARWYDSYLNRWASSDTIVPKSAIPQTLNRYSYVNNSPLGYRDPSGHCSENMSSIQKANDQCWLKYNEIYNMLDLGAVAGLSALDYNALSALGTSLEQWQKRGIVFENGATSWGADGISAVLNGLNAAEAKFGSWDKMKPFLGINQDGDSYTLGRDIANSRCPGYVGCGQRTRADFAHDPSQDLFLHELGHTVDEWLGTMHGTSDYGYWSTEGRGLEGFGWSWTGSGRYAYADGHQAEIQDWVYVDFNRDAPLKSPADPANDFADSFLVWVVGAHSGYRSLSPQREAVLRVSLLGP